jgi:CO/xanthine dehydrogenase FAD-binding subunit
VRGATTIAELLTDPLITQFGAPLQQAAAVLGSPLVRNRATLAGNLVDASPAADTAPPLLALRAEVELMSQTVSRRIPLDDFLVGPNQTVLRPQDLVVAIHWPAPGPRMVGLFTKIGLRKALACSVVSAAVVVEAEPGGRCANARIALGAVAPRPIRAREAEELLQGRTLTPEAIAEAARVASELSRPIDDVRGTSAYRKRMVEVLVRRLLVASARRIESLPENR